MKFVLEVIIGTNCKPGDDKNIRNCPNSSYFENFKMLFVINCENHFFVDGVKPLGETYSFLKRKTPNKSRHTTVKICFSSEWYHSGINTRKKWQEMSLVREQTTIQRPEKEKNWKWKQ